MAALPALSRPTLFPTGTQPSNKDALACLRVLHVCPPLYHISDYTPCLRCPAQSPPHATAHAPQAPPAPARTCAALRTVSTGTPRAMSASADGPAMADATMAAIGGSSDT